MPVGVLTAALQELTPREKRDPDPDLAVEEWLDFAKELGADCIELSAALHPSLADVPAEAMLDPVANTLDLREPFDEQRAKRVLAAVDDTGVTIADVAYFDDMLHEDPAIRRKKHDFMLRAMDTAVLLGVSAVTGFVGRNQSKSMDQNLIEFEKSFVPLLKAAKDRGLQYRVEQCPMPGWTAGDNFHNNIAYTPGMWIALHQICERNGVGDQFRIHYDPSHSILMGQDTRSMFQYLADEGYGFLIAGMHVKGQVVDSKGVAGWGYGGQTVQRGDWDDGEISPNPADLANAWKKQTVLCEHELPGTARHDPLAYLQNRTRRLARPPARRPRAARLRHGHDAADRRARVPGGAGAGRAAARADPGGLDRLHPAHRRGRGGDVRAAARGAACPGHPRPGRRPPGVPELIAVIVLVVGTGDTKGREVAYVAEVVRARGVDAVVVDVGTTPHRVRRGRCPSRRGRRPPSRRRRRGVLGRPRRGGRSDVGGARAYVRRRAPTWPASSASAAPAARR